MLLRVTQTLALVACVVMVATVTNAFAGNCSCAPGSPCIHGGSYNPYANVPQNRGYCVTGRCCQPGNPWGHFDRQWMPWPGEDRDDVGSASTTRTRELIPHGEGQKPVKLEKEKYPEVNIDGTPGMMPGTGPGFNIEGTGETPMPFNVPQVPSGLDPGIPSGEIPSGEIPFDPSSEGGISPDILPAEPFSIEGTEEEKDKKKPESTPLPSDSGLNEQEAPLPTTPTIQLKDAPMPANRPSSLIVQEGTIEPLPPTTEESSRPASYNTAPMPSVRPSSYVPTRRQPAPIYNDPAPVPTQNVTPAPIYNEAPAPAYGSPAPSDQWRSRRLPAEESAPMPETQAPAAGRHVQYQQSQEAPMPEAIPTTVAESSQPLALEGYCPVELVLNERWIQGNAQWTASHKGRSYQFSSREAFDTFCRNPELYAPYYSGIDPVVALAGGGMLDGRTDLCAVYHGRLYMFSSQESLNQFRANPAECIKAFDTHLKTK